MKENYLVTIIIPIFRVENYLYQCVNSVLNQSYKNLEIILVDDGSPDRCPQICDELAQKDQRIKVIHKDNGGLSSARNAGLDIATGDYIMFTDSDDFIDKTMVEDLMNLLLKTKSDIACCEMKRYKNGVAKQIPQYHLEKEITEFNKTELLKSFIVRRIDCASWNKLFKREIIGNRRFINGRYNEDYIFLFFLYLTCKKVVYTNHAYYNYRVTEGSITNKFSNKSIDKLKNAIEIENYILSNNLDYAKEIHQYKISVCMEIAWSIKKNKASKDYKEEFAYCKKNILNNSLYILFNINYPLYLKVQGLLSLC